MYRGGGGGRDRKASSVVALVDLVGLPPSRAEPSLSESSMSLGSISSEK